MRIQRVDVQAFFTAIAICAAGLTGYMVWADRSERNQRREEWQAKRDEPASSWYVVRGVNVLAFVEGDDTQVSFDREIRQPFTLEWTLQTYSAEAKPGQRPECATDGKNFLTPNPSNEITVIPWSELWRKDPCNLRAGNYILKAHGVLKIVGYPEKEVERASNIFRVLPKGSQLFIEPEQAQKLESIQ